MRTPSISLRTILNETYQKVSFTQKKPTRMSLASLFRSCPRPLCPPKARTRVRTRRAVFQHQRITASPARRVASRTRAMSTHRCCVGTAAGNLNGLDLPRCFVLQPRHTSGYQQFAPLCGRMYMRTYNHTTLTTCAVSHKSEAFSHI